MITSAAWAQLAPDPLCPEILAWNTLDFKGLWERARALDENAQVPYWGIVWPGGRGMARFILDNKKIFRGKRVLDLGTGSGITAVAAAMAGAEVTGIDIDPAAIALAVVTAEANKVKCKFIQTGTDEISQYLEGQYQIIMAGDIFNSREFAESALALVRRGLSSGIMNYLSDSGRSHKPVKGTERILTMRVPVFREIEGVRERDVTIFRVIE